MPRLWHRLLAVLALFFCIGATAAAELREGRNYHRLAPPLPPDRTRIEVLEFFWYGCPHCNDFEPIVAAWAARLPADVVFRRQPAIFDNEGWVPGARLFYTLEAINQLDRLHPLVFNAIHVERRRLNDEKQLFDWVAGQSVDLPAFQAAWTSFGVQSRVGQARETSRRSRIGGVPAVVVDGRYLAVMPEKFQDLLPVLDQLIERARTERGKR